MEPMDPVPWDALEPVVGVPGAELDPFVERHVGDLPDDRGAAVKRVYDDWKTELGEERSVADQGASYLVAYLLEGAGELDPRVTERRPSAERLHAMVHDREWTLWYVAVDCGVHYSLVTRWCYEADVPLLWRNLGGETREAVRERLE